MKRPDEAPGGHRKSALNMKITVCQAVALSSSVAHRISQACCHSFVAIASTIFSCKTCDRDSQQIGGNLEHQKGSQFYRIWDVLFDKP